MGVAEFCRALDSAMASLLENVGAIINKYRKGTLLMSEALPLFRSLGSPDELKRLFKAI